MVCTRRASRYLQEEHGCCKYEIIAEENAQDSKWRRVSVKGTHNHPIAASQSPSSAAYRPASPPHFSPSGLSLAITPLRTTLSSFRFRLRFQFPSLRTLCSFNSSSLLFVLYVPSSNSSSRTPCSLLPLLDQNLSVRSYLVRSFFRFCSFYPRSNAFCPLLNRSRITGVPYLDIDDS